MNIREERVNNDLFLVIRLFWVEFFPRPMWRVQARVKGWYITCYLSEASLKKCFLSGIILSYWPGVNYIHGYMTRGADLKLSIYSSRSKRGHQKFIIYAKKWNWLFLQKSYKNFEMWSVQKTNWKKSFKKVVIGSKKRLKKKFEKSCDWFTWPCRCPFRAANASRGSYNSFLSENICQLSFSISICICTSHLKWRIWQLL